MTKIYEYCIPSSRSRLNLKFLSQPDFKFFSQPDFISSFSASQTSFQVSQPTTIHILCVCFQSMIQKGIHELQGLVYTALRRVVTNKSTREVGLSWLATLISLNELRTSSVMQDNSGVQPVCSDGWCPLSRSGLWV